MALDATVGGASSNSFVTLAEAETYFADRLGASDNGNWNKDSSGTSRTDAQKSAALVTASRRINEETFAGYKASTTQALKCPRYDIYDEDGNVYSSESIPTIVKEATFIAAVELLRANWIDENGLGNIDFLSTGSVQIKQFTQSSVGTLPADARRLLKPVLAGGSGGGRITRA